MSSGKSKTKKKRTYRHRVGKKRNHTDTSIDVNSIHSRTLSYLSRNNNNNSNKTENNNNTTNTNSNLLTFSALPNNLSVSLPSSPINRAESTNATKTSKNKRFNVEVVNKINKLQRFSSMNNICDKKERKRMTPISRAKRKTKSSRKRKKSGENIRVMVRFRPFNAKEIAFNMKEYNNSRSVCDEIIFSNKNKKICLNYITSNNMLRRYSFKFDKIFTAKSSQKTIFNNVCKPICDDLLQFKSNRGTIFCYGQSGSGKSYTFFGKNNNKTEMDHNNKSMGVVARCCAYILNELCNIKESLFNVFTEFSYNICMECMEIYNEKLIDLLNVNSKQSPIIRERKHIEIHHITRKPVQCEADILNLLQIASVNRNMDRTALNKNSSRSHMIIRVIINSVNSDLNRKTQSILNFIDLAGSENIKKLKNGVNKKKQVVEAGNILKSLTTLSQVIDALVKNKKHIPYKESKLTRILHNSLGGNCRTALLICASANIYNRYETIRSLKFGKRCQQIKNCVKYNQGQIIQNPNQSATRNNKSNLKLKLKKSVSACSNKSVIVKDDKFDCKTLLKEIEKLKVENDLLRKKEELSDNICTLNETITKIALQNAFKKNNGQKKIKNELNIFQSKLIQVTIALNAKMDQIKELIDEGQTLLINNEREGQEEEQQNEQINTNNNLLNSINFNQKIYSEAMVQQLKQKNLNLVQEIAKLKQCQSQCKLVKTPRASNSNSMSTNTAYHPSPIRIDNNINKEANDTYYICDDEDIYGNAYAYNQENGENNKQQTLSEQLNVMDAMRQMDKDNLDLLQSPIHKNKVTELPNKFDICSNSNSNSHSHRISPRDSITLLKNAHLLPSNESSARSSIKSQSVLSTTIDSIDEHLEKWNNGISANQHRLSNMEMYNRRRSSVNTAISVSLSSGNSLDLQPILCTESGTGNGNGNGNAVEFGVDAEEKGDKSNLDGGVLKEEENEEEESLSDEEYDYYSETDDDQSYYNNSFNGIHNTFHRTKTESQIFRSIGMELSKKLKAKSVESPCQNNQRLSIELIVTPTMTEDSMVCLGVVVAGTVLTLRVVAIGCSVTCSTIFEDEDFLSNCIEPTNIGIIQPNEGEFAALSSVPLFACIWACLLGCCYNQCEEFVSRTLGCSLIVELLIYLILFAHIGAYLINLDNTFGGSTCAMNDDFNNAVNWTKTGLIISVIIVGMPCCVACVAICASALNDGETTTKPSTNTPTKPVVVVQAPPRTNHGSEVGLTHQQKRIVGGVMSYLLVEQCGFWIATDSKKASVLRSLKQQTPSGQTALRDAVIYGLVKMFALKMILNKFIHIVLTDGMDNKSSHSPQEIKDMFQLIGAKLGAAYGKTFFIGIDLGVSEKAALQNIADIAGDAAELHHCQDVGLHHVFERIKINVGLQRRVLAVSDGENAVLMSENRLFLQPERQKFLVLFSLDKSGSMSGKRWDILQTALDSFFRGLDASDIIGCVLFNDDVKCITE